ncbi:hypothetical protein [Rhizobium grahamii]|uniref:Twin-arginine translocation signal domain-containing protein n=1 Tax=Rhizobium grahamii TaxID=1120045 RepID=A0A370KUI8_9HYPH|nr:hypothetical protein [Rhizobium grahamii]RDJ13944.1 hypothetical protein B5K06_08240 [Rhizobium grahamii]
MDRKYVKPTRRDLIAGAFNVAAAAALLQAIPPPSTGQSPSLRLRCGWPTVPDSWAQRTVVSNARTCGRATRSTASVSAK